MRYTKISILMCLTFGSTSLSILNPILRTNTDVSNVYNNSKVTRHRRSIWTDMVEHISNVVKALYPSTVVVEGFEGIGRVQKEENKDKKLVNIMFKKRKYAKKISYEKFLGRRKKAVKELTVEEILAVPVVEDTTPRELIVDKSFFNLTLDEVRAHARAMVRRRVIIEKVTRPPKVVVTMATGLNPDEHELELGILKLKKQHDDVNKREDEFIKALCHVKADWKSRLKDAIIKWGTNTVMSDKFISRILQKSPSLQDYVEKELKEMRETRSDLRRQQWKYFQTLFITKRKQVSDEFFERMKETLDRDRIYNEEWLSHKTRITWVGRGNDGKKRKHEIRVRVVSPFEIDVPDPNIRKK